MNLTKGLRELPPLIEQQLGEYACGDADNTLGVFRWLLGMGFPLPELAVIDITIRMFANPVLRLDVPRARKLLASVIRSKRSALRRLGITKGQVSSTNQFSELLLERFGIETEMKAGKPAKDGTTRLIPALAKTDAFMKSLLEHENPDVQALAAIRLEVKSTLEETRLYRLLAMAKRGALCVYLNFAGAHTLRWSGGDKMNWQNFPRGSELRKCILAPEGYVLVVADKSQIEARILNTLAEQWDVLELFEKGDPYSVLASKFFGRPVDGKRIPEDKPLRHIGKVGELGLGYGMGPPKLKNTLRVGAMGGPPVIIPIETAKLWVSAYRESHPEVVKLWAQGETVLGMLHAKVENYPWGPMILHRGYVYLPGGTRLDYTGLVREDGDWLMRDRWGKLILNTYGAPVRLYGAMFIENIVQALSRANIAQDMPAIAEAGYPLVMTTHDELVACVPAAQGQACHDFMIATMTKRPSWLPRIPLAAEGGFDVCYSK